MTSEQVDFDNQSHRRWNPLTQSWVLCSPHRAKRPWQGQVEKLAVDERPSFDPKCYLCPGNTRVGGHLNPGYESTYTFPNDFPAVQATVTTKPAEIEWSDKVDDMLFKAEATRGECHVICFNPNHALTVAQMTTEQVLPVISAWTEIYRKFCAISYINYCQIFENKGEMMGCSNPHPHGQVWGTEQIPEEPRKEIEGFKDYRAKCGGCLLCDYVQREVAKKERVVCENEHFVCLWPYETMILPRKHKRHLLDFAEEEKLALADIIRRITCRYDNVFECSFPYSMGLHQAPSVEDVLNDKPNDDVDVFHFHMHFYPPLLRSATVKKFLVGFEMLGTPQRDLTSEQAAERLSSMSEIHYKNK